MELSLPACCSSRSTNQIKLFLHERDGRKDRGWRVTPSKHRHPGDEGKSEQQKEPIEIQHGTQPHDSPAKRLICYCLSQETAEMEEAGQRKGKVWKSQLCEAAVTIFLSRALDHLLTRDKDPG